MASVPYNPAEFVAPGGPATPEVHPRVSGAAFGANIAESIEGLGNTLQHSGDELFTRALALQQLQNETEAKNGDAQYMIEAGKLHAQFSTLEGTQAGPDALDAHIKNLEDLRQRFRDSMSTPNAQKMFDSNSLSTMGRNVFNAAGHAATETKKAALGASQARINTMGESALYNATDEKAFQRDTASTLAEVESKGALLGWDRDTINNAKAGELSKRWSQRILGLSRTDPQQANTMLEKAMEDHTIQAQDYYKVQGHVLQQLHTQGSRNISDSVNNGWAPYMTAPEIQRATGVDDTLLRVVKKAQQDNPNLQFTIGAEGGRRSQSEQDRLYAQGRTAPGNVVTYTRSSDHLDGRAIDLVAKSGTNQAAVTAAMEKASADLGIPLAQKSAAFASFDPGHYALPKDYNVKNAPQPVEQPLKDRVAAAEDYARRTQPNDTMFSDAVRDRVISDFNRGKAIQRDADYTNGNTVTGGVIGSYGGKLPTTVEELKALDPKVAAAWDGLDNIKQQKYLRYLSQNAKGDTSWTQEGLRQFAALRSMASGDDTDRQAFLGTDVLGLQGITNAAKLQLNALQQKSLKVPDDDPALNKAISYLGTKMFNAGVTRGQDKDRYYDFRGALQDQLQTFQQDHKKMTGPKEWDEIGSKLLQEQSAPWMFGLFNSKTPTFEVPVPDKDQAEIKQFLTEKNKGTEPSDKDIQRFWIAVQYQRLYGKKDAGK